MDRVRRQVHLEAQLNTEQSAQLFAKILHELVELGEIEPAQAQVAIAELKRPRFNDANAAKELGYFKEEQAMRMAHPDSPNRLRRWAATLWNS